MFYGDFCPACQSAFPEFSKASKLSQGMINFGIVDSSKESIAQQMNIKYLPTFLLFHENGQTEYKGARSSEDFNNFLSPYFASCFSSNFFKDGKILTDKKSRLAILFNEKSDSSLSWKIFSCLKHQKDTKSMIQNRFSKKSRSIQILYSNSSAFRISMGSMNAPVIFLKNESHSVMFNNEKDAINNFTSFFEGNYFVNEKIEIYLPMEMKFECVSPSKYCILFNTDDISPNVKEITEKINRKFPAKFLKFFQGSEREWKSRMENFSKNEVILMNIQKEIQFKLKLEDVASTINQISNEIQKYESSS